MRRADNLTAIWEPIVYTMWDPQQLTTLKAPTACYEESSVLMGVDKKTELVFY
jgi:hypothetical protein